MANFDIAYKKTASQEGGYVKDPRDKGGETYMGISRKYHPDWEGWKKFIDPCNNPEFGSTLKRGDIIDVEELHSLVKSFYKENFWDRLRCSSLESQEIADELYDTAVNMGIVTAVKILQRSINLLISGSISVDGIIGYKTLCNANQINPKYLLKTLNGFQFMKYVSICETNPSQEKFFKGWLKRV